MSLPNLLNQTITLYEKSSYDEYGRETLTSGSTYVARVQEVTKSRLLPSGQTIVIDAIVYLNAAPSIEVNDRIDYAGRKYKVAGKSLAVDGQGSTNHTKLELIKWFET